MLIKYKKSQIGWGLLSFFAFTIIFLFLAYANQWGDDPVPLALFISLSSFLILICSLFYRLTVQVNESTIRLIYGIGLIKIDLHIEVLEKTEVIKTPWYYGLGIRITPKGMLYNLQGRKAVQIDYVNKGFKKTAIIGSAEPEKLEKAILNNWKNSK